MNKSLPGYTSKTISFDVMEALARITSHIPKKGQKMIRYYGAYSSVKRGKARAGNKSLPGNRDIPYRESPLATRLLKPSETGS